MKYHLDILGTIGNTPLVKLNKIVKDLPCTVLAKIETQNPGNSIKDRMALKLVIDAENSGKLKPGGTIVEGTSGNTGMGLAIAAIVKGYQLICVLNDKQSKEKMDILRAMGAEVVVCPTNVEPDDPNSYYSVAKKLAREIPNAWYVDQYNNLSNSIAHYETTGPEIWKDTEGGITHLVVGVGTGGTISGAGKFLKEKNKDIQLLGVDTYGSIFKKYHETGIFDPNEIYPYITEGIGEDILPANVDFKIIDYFEKVTDKDAALYTRKLAREEGIFVGNSSGAVIKGLLQMKDRFTEQDVVVVIFHDHGSRYVGKIFNDEWMKERGFLIDEKRTAAGLVENHTDLPLISLKAEELVSHAIEKMRHYKISQIPVTRDGEFVGSLDESNIFDAMLDNPEISKSPISEIMQAPFPVVKKDLPIEEISKLISRENPAVLVEMERDKYHIITKYDIIMNIE